ncbi:MAG: ATPase [Citrobacter freundii]|nr:MAG: ATPase [Citrobacter freundii]
MNNIIGRVEEIKLLQHSLKGKDAALIAVYGRRRVGKTYLIHNFFAKQLIFELTGMPNGNLKDQLFQFSKAFQKLAGSSLAIRSPASWAEAFDALERQLETMPKSGKQALFFDEIPWLDTRRSGFLSAFEHFWNTYASRQKHLIIVVCGSAASWMIKEVVNSKGGLHHRITQKIRLLPFTLQETETYLQYRGCRLKRYQILEIYMALGGIPQYLNNIQKGESPAQAIQRICFTKDGLLTGEFDNLYKALFELADNHLKAVRALAATANGLTRQEIIDKCGISSGGRASTMLEELEASGFVHSYQPYGKVSKDLIYRLTDEFSLFYLKFMDIRNKQNWKRLSEGLQYRIWCGMSFESICLKHVEQIKSAIGIKDQNTWEGSWRYIPGKGSNENGAQIDLLIERDDNCINICEIKFYNSQLVIDKKYAKELQQKIDVFQQKTNAKATLFLTIITTYGLKENIYGDLVQASVQIDQLF